MRLLLILSLIFLMSSFISAVENTEQTFTQTVTANIISGTMDIFSPVMHFYNISSIRMNISYYQNVSYLEYKDYAQQYPRWRTLCSSLFSCKKSYNSIKEFTNGWHNLTIKARLPNGENITENVSFFVDTLKPDIRGYLPTFNKFTNGSFFIKYTEDNLKETQLKIFNNSSNKICPSGRYKNCSFEVDLNNYNNKTINYSFIVIDIANNFKSTRIIPTKVDTLSPVINNPENLINISGRYALFKINITEQNFDKVGYYRIINGINRYVDLCTRLAGNICSHRDYFALGNYTIQIIVLDKAGNSNSIEKSFTIK